MLSLLLSAAILLFAVGSFDAFLIPVVTMEMQGFCFFFRQLCCERQVHGRDPR